MKHEDVTIVMQGPLVSTYDESTAEGLHYLDEYLNLVDKIIISTWENSVGSFIDNADKIIENKNITVVKEDISKYDDYYNNSNVAYQAASSLNGLKKVNTKYAIKLRCDEYYTKLSKFIQAMKSNPEKLTTSNFMFAPDDLEQLHPSDHIAGGKTENILGMYQTALDFCKKLPARKNPAHCSMLGVENYRGLYKGLHNNGEVSPEAFLFISFLKNKGVDIDCSQSKKIMNDHAQLVHLRDMGNFLCKVKGKSYSSYEHVKSHHDCDFSIENMEQL